MILDVDPPSRSCLQFNPHHRSSARRKAWENGSLKKMLSFVFPMLYPHTNTDKSTIAQRVVARESWERTEKKNWKTFSLPIPFFLLPVTMIRVWLLLLFVDAPTFRGRFSLIVTLLCHRSFMYIYNLIVRSFQHLFSLFFHRLVWWASFSSFLLAFLFWGKLKCKNDNWKRLERTFPKNKQVKKEEVEMGMRK